MLLHCFRCREKTDSKSPRAAKTNKEKLTILSKFAICDTKKLRFIKYQEASGLLRSLGINTVFSKIPLLGPFLFERYKMDEILNKFLISGDKFVLEMHLRQPELNYSACGPFTKNKGYKD